MDDLLALQGAYSITKYESLIWFGKVKLGDLFVSYEFNGLWLMGCLLYLLLPSLDKIL